MAYFLVADSCKWIIFLVNIVLQQHAVHGLQFMFDPTVSNMHVPEGRISTIEVAGADNCMVECYLEPQCVSVGFSKGYRSCQLYNIDLTGFAYSLIAQADTVFYKAVCNQSDYTYVRPLNTCMKRHVNELNFVDAYQTCTEEGASLMILSDDTTRTYLKNAMDHIHDTTFEYILAGAFYMTAWSWIHGNDIDSNNGATYWDAGEPNITKGECVSMTSSPGNNLVLTAANCTATYHFLCHMMPK